MPAASAATPLLCACAMGCCPSHARPCLRIVHRVPGVVVDDQPPRPDQVDAHRPSLAADQEHLRITSRQGSHLVNVRLTRLMPTDTRRCCCSGTPAHHQQAGCADASRWWDALLEKQPSTKHRALCSCWPGIGAAGPSSAARTMGTSGAVGAPPVPAPASGTSLAKRRMRSLRSAGLVWPSRRRYCLSRRQPS